MDVVYLSAVLAWAAAVAALAMACAAWERAPR